MRLPSPTLKNHAECALSVASSIDVRVASFGTIKTDELIDYDNQCLHHDGLFSQRIFGPVASWHCECGKYCGQDSDAGEREFTPRPTVCEKCHIYAGENKIRRHRFAHIDLAAPILHPWLWGNSQRPVELLLGLTTRELRRILDGTLYVLLHKVSWYHELNLAMVVPQAAAPFAPVEVPTRKSGLEAIRHLLENVDLESLRRRLIGELSNLDPADRVWGRLARRLELVQSLGERRRSPNDFIMEVLPVLPAGLRRIRATARGAVRVDELTRRYQELIRYNNSVNRYSENADELCRIRWQLAKLVSCVLELLPGGFPYPMSDELELPARFIAEGESDDPVSLASGSVVRRYQPLKSNRGAAAATTSFRPPLPIWRGKRVDYSATSVVVPDSSLRLDECGLPLDPIAWELYRPLVVASIVRRERFSKEIAEAFVTCRGELASDHLAFQMRLCPVLLSFAGVRPSSRVKAFGCRPVNDRAIHIHPAVLAQLGIEATGGRAKVFLPLSSQATNEAVRMQKFATSTNSQADRPFTFWPAFEALLGANLATRMDKGLLECNEAQLDNPGWRRFRDPAEIGLAISLGKLTWTTPVVFHFAEARPVMNNATDAAPFPLAQRIFTTAGRVVLNQLLEEAIGPWKELPYLNAALSEKYFRRLRDWFLQQDKCQQLHRVVRTLNDWGHARLTQSGLSISSYDFKVSSNQAKLVEEAWKQVAKKRRLYDRGIICHNEMINQEIDTWVNAREQVIQEVAQQLTNPVTQNALTAQLLAGTKRWSINAPVLRRLVGLTGPVVALNGSYQRMPVISNLHGGLNTSEYFILLPGQRRFRLTHRENLRDRRRLIRRLAPVLRDVRVTRDDCQTSEGIEKRSMYNPWGWGQLRSATAALPGRNSAETIVNPVTEETLLTAGDTISPAVAAKLEIAGPASFKVRSPLTCAEVSGVCGVCYGRHPQDMHHKLESKALGAEVLLALADQLATGHSTSYFFISRPQGSDSGELRALKSGVVSLHDVNFASTPDGKRVVLSRRGKIHLLDNRSRQIMSEEVPHGAILEVYDREAVWAGKVLAIWDPASPKYFAIDDATVTLINLFPARNVMEDTRADGQRQWKVTNDCAPTPMLLLTSPAGVRLDYFYLPKDTWLAVRSGQTVSRGGLLAQTIPTSEFRTSYQVPGVDALARRLNARTDAPQAILAECSGQVEVSTLDLQGRCNVLIHEVNAIGRRTGEVIAHAMPPYQRLLVRSGDKVSAGDCLTPGDVSLHDVLRICGVRNASDRLLNSVLQGLTLNRALAEVGVDDRLWELVVARLFEQAVVTAPGSSDLRPGQIVRAKWLKKLNERYRRSFQVTEMGDSRLTVGDIIPDETFKDTCEYVKSQHGTLPQAMRPWTVGFRPQLLGLNRASQTLGQSWLTVNRRALRENILHAAIHGHAGYRDSLQFAVLTGRLMAAGTGWWTRERPERVLS